MTLLREGQKSGKPRARAQYQPPELRVYGAIKDLTAAGTAGEKESGAAMGNPLKRP